MVGGGRFQTLGPFPGVALGRAGRPRAAPGHGAGRARAPRQAAGLECRVVACAYSLNGSRPLAIELLDGPERPSAVLCLSDSIAYGVYAACAEHGLAIPGDVAVAGFGDHPISRLLAPPLTSTVWDVDQAAERATSFLLQAIEANGPQATLREVVAPVLAVRASTGPPRVDTPPDRPSVR